METVTEEELSTKQAAALAGVTPRSVNRAIREGKLAAREVQETRGKVYLLKRSDVNAWVAILAVEGRRGRPPLGAGVAIEPVD